MHPSAQGELWTTARRHTVYHRLTCVVVRSVGKPMDKDVVSPCAIRFARSDLVQFRTSTPPHRSSPGHMHSSRRPRI
jgi:hypothetical protein